MAFARDFLISAFAVPIFREGFEATGHWVHWVGRESSFITRKPNFLLPTNTIYHSTLMHFVNFMFCLVLHTVRRMSCCCWNWPTLLKNSKYSYIYSDSIQMTIKYFNILTIFGHFFANCMVIFQKTEVQTVTLRCLTGLNLEF